MTTLLAVAVVFGLVMIAHEWGHFISAKRAGIKVYEFGIGIGPRLFSFTRGGTLFTIRPIPIIAFVRMAGESQADDMAAPDSFPNRPLFGRIMTIAAGPLMNFILGLLAFAIVFMGQGYPVATTEISQVSVGAPAAEAGLQPGDVITAYNGTAVANPDAVRQAIRQGQPLVLTIKRGAEQLDVTVAPRVTAESEGNPVIGVIFGYRLQRLGLLQAISTGAKETLAMLQLMVQYLVAFITRRPSAAGFDVTGPIGIVSVIGQAAKSSIYDLIWTLGVISANVGLFNLLPIPALDGSRLVFLAIEGVRGKPIDPKKESLVHAIGYFLLLALAAVVAYRDVLRLRGPLP